MDKSQHVDKWRVDNFKINRISAAFTDVAPIDFIHDDRELQGVTLRDAEPFDAAALMEFKRHYPVEFDVEPFFIENVVSVVLTAEVNAKLKYPGYRISCAVQSDYMLANDHPAEITQGMISAEDMEFFLNDTHIAMQDHLLLLTESMILGPYILPPPDLDAALGEAIDDLLDLG